MTKTLVAFVAAVSIGVAALAAPTPTKADCLGCALFGGFLAGAVIGSAVAAPRYYGPPPGPYYAGPPGPGCHYANRPVWDPYSGTYRPGPPVVVCP